MKIIFKKTLLTFAALTAILLSCDSNLFGSKQPPVIDDIRTDNDIYKVYPGDTVTVVVTATNPEEGSLSYAWSADGGDLLLPHNRDEVKWVAPNIGGGHFTIEVTVSNVSDKSATADIQIEVISQDNPTVQILSPDEGEFLVQFTEITISANASHPNGLQSVKLLVNDTLKATLPPQNNSNLYEFDYALDLPGGLNTFKVEAAAKNTGFIGSDSVTVSIEVILPKKK